MKNARRQRWALPAWRRRWGIGIWACLALLPTACGGERSLGAPAPQPLLAAVVAVGLPSDTAVGTAGYSVINLGPGQIREAPLLNARGQVAFSLQLGLDARAFFFDGERTRDIGTLGGATAFARGLNDAGQIAGYADNAAQHPHAFRWSAAAGMRDLGTIGGTDTSYGFGINQAGQVAGYSHVPGPFFERPQAVIWSEAGGMRSMGQLAEGLSVAAALNDRGQAVGYATAPGGEAHAFAWTAPAGMADLGTLGGSDSYAQVINPAGTIAGYAMAPDSPDFQYRGFVWRAGAGMRDIGTLGGGASAAMAINAGGQVAGMADNAEALQHAVRWSEPGGLVDLGTLGGAGSSALALNERNVVVGWSLLGGADYRSHAFVARPGGTMADLNAQLLDAPPGLELDVATAVNDQGAIVASSNAGLVLLVPGPKGGDAPLLGPIPEPGPVAVGTRVALAAAFRDRNRNDTHRAVWSWGDACPAQAGSLAEAGGRGEATGAHVFCAPGFYTVILTVTDSTGRSSRVAREVVVFDPAEAGLAGSGSFRSPRGAHPGDPLHAGAARFAVLTRTRGEATLLVNTGKWLFEGSGLRRLADGGAEGGGKFNGRPGYRFVLAATPDRLRLRITHRDPASGAEVVDYDNRAAGQGWFRGAQGSALSAGALLVGRR